MRDASVRVLTSAAAALAVYFVLTLVASLDTWAKVVVSGLAALLGWWIASRLAGGDKSNAISRVATGITGRNVRVDGVKAKGGAGPRHTASDIHASQDVTITNVEDEGNGG